MQNEELTKELNALQEKFNKEIEDVKKKYEKPMFEMGKWYVLNCDYCFLVNISEIKDNNIYGYGFNYYGTHNEYIENHKNNWVNIKSLNSYHLATPKEVEEALIKEAIKIGFKDGVKVNKSVFKGTNLMSVGCSDNVKINRNNFKYISNDNVLLIDGNSIFCNGTWAEIVKEKTLDELASEYKKLYWYRAYSIEENFKQFLTENKQEVINILNNL